MYLISTWRPKKKQIASFPTLGNNSEVQGNSQPQAKYFSQFNLPNNYVNNKEVRMPSDQPFYLHVRPE